MTRWTKFRLLSTTAILVVSASPAFADPISLTAAFTAISASISGLTAASVVSTLATSFINTIIGVGAATLLQKIFGQKPTGSNVDRGSILQVQVGDTVPMTFTAGHTATAGKRKYMGSWGQEGKSPNAYLVEVLELGNLPVGGLRRVQFDGEVTEVDWENPHPDGRGCSINMFYDDGREEEMGWIKFYDGTQTTADPYLRDKFGDNPDRPYKSTMIGRGCPYVILTYRFNDDIYKSKPNGIFEPESVMFYDLRKDSTNGGSGSHRWDNPSTWEPSDNCAVGCYNIIRGMYYDGKWFYGGRNLAAWKLPASNWIAAANASDFAVDIPGDVTEVNYTYGLEVPVINGALDTIDKVRTACNGRIAELGGVFKMIVGLPGSAIYAITDDDIIITDVQDYDPFPSFKDCNNGINAKYAEPAEAWSLKDAPAFRSASYKAQDGDEELMADVTFDAVNNLLQCQRLQYTILKDERRFREHQFVLPPGAFALEPLDCISWSSVRNGYDEKMFLITRVVRRPNFVIQITVKEVNPADYDFDTDYKIPPSLGWIGRINPDAQDVTGWQVFPDTVYDDNGIARRPTIRFTCEQDLEDIQRIHVRIRKYGSNDVVFDADHIRYGEPYSWKLNGWFIPNTHYQFQGELITGGRRRVGKSAWLDVTTLNVLIAEEDLADQFRERIQDIEDAGNENALIAIEARETAEASADLVNGLSGEVLDQLAEIAETLGGIDTGSFNELKGIAIAGYKRGWVKDPSFFYFTGSTPTYWNSVGVSTYASQITQTEGAYYATALLIDVPLGTDVVTMNASTSIAGQLLGADPMLEYVVVSVLLKPVSGSLAGGRLRAEWRETGGSYIRGHALGANNCFGNLTSDWGFVVNNKLQSREIIWKRPVASADQVMVFFAAHGASPTTACKIEVHYVDIRRATDVEIQAYLSGATADAKISAYDLILTGPAGAITAQVNAAKSEFNLALADVSSTIVTIANDQEAIAGRTTVLETQYGGNNLVKNPDWMTNTFNYWYNKPSTWVLVARGTGGTGINTSPTPYVIKMPANSITQTMNTDKFNATEGDQFWVRYKYATGGPTRNISFRVNIRFFDYTGSAIAGGFSGLVSNANNTSWATFYSAESNPAPSGAIQAHVEIQIVGGGVGEGYITLIEVVKLDVSIKASVIAAQSAASDANSAIAVDHNSINAEFGSFEAFVDLTASAVATSGYAASTYVIRFIGGEASFVGWEDETGDHGTIQLDADHVFIPGTLSLGTLSIYNFRNIIPNGSFARGNLRNWSSVPSGWSVVNKNASAGAAAEINMPSAYALKMNHSSSDQVATMLHSSNRQMAEEDDVYVIKFALCGSGSNPYVNAQIRVRWRASDNTTIRIDAFDGFKSTNNWSTYKFVTPEAPANTAFISVDLYRISGPGDEGAGYITNIEVREQFDGAIQIKDGTIGGAKLITTDVLIANTAQIGELVVGTSNIKNNGVSSGASVLATSTATFSHTSGSEVIQTFVLNKVRSGGVKIEYAAEGRCTGGGSYTMYLYQNGDRIETPGSGVDHTSGSFTIRSTSTVILDLDADTSYTFTLRLVYNGGGSGIQVRNRFIGVIEFTSMKK